MKKQTAVEWLIDQLIPKDQHEGIMDIIQEAKEMEKEQIEDAYQLGFEDGDSNVSIYVDKKEYYNQTYGGDK